MAEFYQEPIFDEADIEKNKVPALLAYIIFFIPLIADQNSKFGKYHANQGLILLIFWLIFAVVIGAIPILGWIISFAAGICSLVLCILGVINAVNGKAKPLPLIGKFKLIAPF